MNGFWVWRIRRPFGLLLGAAFLGVCWMYVATDTGTTGDLLRRLMTVVVGVAVMALAGLLGDAVFRTLTRAKGQSANGEEADPLGTSVFPSGVGGGGKVEEETRGKHPQRDGRGQPT